MFPHRDLRLSLTSAHHPNARKVTVDVLFVFDLRYLPGDDDDAMWMETEKL